MYTDPSKNLLELLMRVLDLHFFSCMCSSLEYLKVVLSISLRYVHCSIQKVTQGSYGSVTNVQVTFIYSG